MSNDGGLALVDLDESAVLDDSADLDQPVDVLVVSLDQLVAYEIKIISQILNVFDKISGIPRPKTGLHPKETRGQYYVFIINISVLEYRHMGRYRETKVETNKWYFSKNHLHIGNIAVLDHRTTFHSIRQASGDAYRRAI